VGFLPDSVTFLAAILQSGVSYERTLILGRQWLMCDHAQLKRSVAKAGVDLSDDQARLIHSTYAEPFLRFLGAVQIDSLDATDYEGCTIVHDLNTPLPHTYDRAYSAVIDGGTLAHVLSTAIRSCLEAVAIGVITLP
jgi:hypothetical protein